MTARIIVDSTSDLLPTIKKRVSVVPLTVHFGTEEYIDGVTIDHTMFYEKLVEDDVLPSTSQATPAAFVARFQQIQEAGDVDFSMPVLLGYTGMSDVLLMKYIKDSRHLWEGNLDEVRYTTIGSVIGTHAGPGAVAVAFFKK